MRGDECCFDIILCWCRMSLSSPCFQVKGPAEAAGRHGPHHHQPVPAAGKPQAFPLPVIRDDQLNVHIKSPSSSSVVFSSSRFTRPSRTAKVPSVLSFSPSNTHMSPTPGSRWDSFPLKYMYYIGRIEPHLCVCVLQLASPEEKCQQLLEPPYDEMVAAHLR